MGMLTVVEHMLKLLHGGGDCTLASAGLGSRHLWLGVSPRCHLMACSCRTGHRWCGQCATPCGMHPCDAFIEVDRGITSQTVSHTSSVLSPLHQMEPCATLAQLPAADGSFACSLHAVTAYAQGLQVVYSCWIRALLCACAVSHWVAGMPHYPT